MEQRPSSDGRYGGGERQGGYDRYGGGDRYGGRGDSRGVGAGNAFGGQESGSGRYGGGGGGDRPGSGGSSNQPAAERRALSRSPEENTNKRHRPNDGPEASTSGTAGTSPVAPGTATTSAAGGGGGERPKRGDRRERDLDIIRTVPDGLNSKCGTAGTPIRLKANYFELKTMPKFNINQYRIDFEPDIEMVAIRKRLLFEQKPLLGGYLYDTRNTVYLTHKLERSPLVMTGKDREGNAYQMTLKLVGSVSMETRESLQVLNVILRRAMDGLHLQLIGRNFFDAKATVNMPNAQLQLWPGYQTSIRQHETSIMLCADITNKVMRMETVYQILQRHVRENRSDYKSTFQQEVIGTTVLTDYNNRTYRIDDVAFDMTPQSEFGKRDGSKMSFVDYYDSKYKLRIHDRAQPLLISRVAERELRAGQEPLLLLVPELCRATGLTEAQRKNFQLMRSMAEHFRMVPQMRMRRLCDFQRRLSRTVESMEVLEQYDMRLDSELVQLNGRTLPRVDIYTSETERTPSSDRADWNNLFHKSGMVQAVPLRNWVCVYPFQMERQYSELMDKMRLAARNMRYNLELPQRVTLNDTRNHSYMQQIEHALVTHDPQLVMVLVPNNNADM